jgi:hypothetical protein
MQNPQRLGSDQVLLYKREVLNSVLSAVVVEIWCNQCWESPVRENGSWVVKMYVRTRTYILTTQDQFTPRPSTAFGSTYATHSLSPQTPSTGYAISLLPLLTTPSSEPHTCIRVLGHFPISVDSAYHSTPMRHGGVSRPTWQPSVQHLSTDYYPRSKF